MGGPHPGPAWPLGGQLGSGQVHISPLFAHPPCRPFTNTEAPSHASSLLSPGPLALASPPLRDGLGLRLSSVTHAVLLP